MQYQKEVHRQVQESSKKKTSTDKLKCPVKSCGRIVNSESALAIHSRKHYDKKGRKIDVADGSQELY